MQLRFKRVIIENFLSIGTADINLEDRGYCQIIGVNNNPADLAKSNGSGKSSLMSAIVWALTGETANGVKDVVNMFNPGGTSVELHFEADNASYVITRYKEHKKFKTDLKILVNGEDKSGKGIRDSQKLLESYLPDLTPSLIGSVIILGQGLPQRFTNNTPSGRKEVLEKLSKSDFMIEDLKKRLVERKATLNKLLREQEDNILAANTQKTTLQTQITQSEQRLATLEDPAIYSDLIKRTEEKIFYIDNKVQELKTDLDLYRDTYQKASLQKAEIEKDIAERRNAVNVEFLNAKNDINIRKTEFQSAIANLTREITKAKSIKDTCPTCGRKFENVYIPDTTEQECEVESLRIKIADLDKLLSEVVSNNNAEIDSFDAELSERTETLTRELLETQAHISSLEKAISAQQYERTVEQTSLTKYENLKSTYYATVDAINSTIASNKTAIAELEQNLVYYIDSKEKLEVRLEVINKFITITTRDFRGYLLKNVIEFIDKKSKDYCRFIFDTDKLDFILDGNNIDIRYCDKQYESLSGGEKQKVDLIVQFAIRDMLCQFLGFASNILVLDEIFDNLDSIGCDRVINMLSQNLSDIDSVFIISHHQDLALPSDSTITVIKQNNGVSTVQ